LAQYLTRSIVQIRCRRAGWLPGDQKVTASGRFLRMGWKRIELLKADGGVRWHVVRTFPRGSTDLKLESRSHFRTRGAISDKLPKTLARAKWIHPARMSQSLLRTTETKINDTSSGFKTLYHSTSQLYVRMLFLRDSDAVSIISPFLRLLTGQIIGNGV
jgi:hypothetical protein